MTRVGAEANHTPGEPEDEGAAALAAVFHSLPAWRPVLTATRARIEELGRVGGSITLADDAQRHTVADVGIRVRGMRLPLARLDAALRTTPHAVGLLELLPAYFGEPLEYRADVAAADRERWIANWDAWRAYALRVDRQDELGQAWLIADEERLARAWRKAPDGLDLAVRQCLEAFAAIRHAAHTQSLAEVAAVSTGDPKGLRANRRTGKLLLRALATMVHGAPPTGALRAGGRAALYAAVGLDTDEVSSAVTVAGLEGAHPVVAALRASGVAVTVPLATLRQLGTVSAVRGTVFVVENRTTFGPLLTAVADIPAEERPTMICGSGQPTLAVRWLLRHLIAGGAVARYHGDFDAGGLQILAGLRREFGASLQPWRMARADYESAVRRAGGGARRLPAAKVAAVRRLTPVLGDIADAVAASGLVAYEESVHDGLVEDLRAEARLP